MPIVQPPARGYPDWQRISNWDSPILWNYGYLHNNTQFFGPIMDVSTFGYLGGTIQEAFAQSNWTAIWYEDPLAAVQLGAITFQLSTLMQLPMQLRIPNLGPFCQVNGNGVGGAFYTVQTRVMATNRVHPSQIISQNPVLIDQQVALIGAAASVAVYPAGYYSGPMRIWFQPTQIGQVYLQYLNAAGNWDYVDGTAQLAANSDSELTWMAPIGAWRIVVTNAAAVPASYYLAVTPSTSGSF